MSSSGRSLSVAYLSKDSEHWLLFESFLPFGCRFLSACDGRGGKSSLMRVVTAMRGECCVTDLSLRSDSIAQVTDVSQSVATTEMRCAC